ncbi:PREDICTED: protein SUPPRESSOR OF npr1-1, CONSTITUTIVE 1-like [Tarenaya hassleriana]|uniref:protein SUPPRESSOR OF npr1-1, CONSTITUTIVE 1-like n=1 Tax=Tarenaya hassleriana TaxID=28532 RepID=UPI00053C7FF5|nr:PREDICTED: protein SUPPRESSOR OF npr1-1, CONSTITUTIVE 1-like [Tarenaya hassleriana]XP_010532028.1 PREDICTED: protein SUPPRESSOR OF npr1-1, CONSTITUTIVE 1-like [Tarenaya hassleriana]XP_010532029.1 PREDICTED: protein SUPPRESSOR OF npr1-1, CONSTITUTIVE 1-like [Tarenaya hassleriana]XP_010532030.1 PREDICTED: protein SUPPRESSOR OF npr1-1, CONSTITUTIVE 1-like [Tarenaya hassleriana]XP_010532031.1 PREDICTED: protein SUPPRESSOR OF npr1-1, CONSTITUTIVE 1-like [Tarenaya hassleriana]XP_010532032.1 PREDI
MATSFFLSIFSFFVVFFRRLRCLLRFRKRTETQMFQQPSGFPNSVSPSPSRSVWKYDVFLSFRGEDVRRGFLSHLYRALTDSGIHVFRDDKALRRGDFIGPALSEAIEESRIAIVVLSESYPNSHWCLRELLHITDCAEKKRLELVPVFYNIDVKRQNRSFNRALAEHELRFGLETVERWRKALAQVGRISGWDSRNWREESDLIQELVQDLSNRLFLVSPSESGEFVGMSSHMRRIQPLLNLNSEDVRMVGIWGMGGVGKTTVAKFIFEILSNKFQCSCLLENVKGKFRQHGPSQLREKILSKIFRRKDLNISGDDNSNGAVKRWLRNRKVLLVLDDVDDIEQLQELAGSSDWFGPGSRIIITTRDKRVLEQHDVEHIYEVEPLVSDQALQLFSNHAFRQPRPHKDFRTLAIDVVDQLGGLPLALKLIGASLYRRDISYWQDKLAILKNNLDNSISKVLRESYDALDKQEKTVFLHVACCFNGEDVDKVKEVLDLFIVSPGRQPLPCTPGIVALVEKCLITVSNEKRIRVHDLLQDLARDIICKEKHPRKRRILWDSDDIRYLFSENAGPEAIEVESIFLKITEEEELHIHPEIFKKMFNLKLLKFYGDSDIKRNQISMPCDLDYLPRLRYLHWDAYCLKSLPAQFSTVYLVELNLTNSSVQTLWNGTQELGNLRRMNLNGCKNLVEIPDLSKATNLEKLKMCHCRSLVEIPSSLGHLAKLVLLELSYCKKLKNLPKNINLRSLKTLHLDGCSSINDFPSGLEDVEDLWLDQTAIEEVPPSVQSLSRLASLSMTGCKRLKNLPDTIKDMDSLSCLRLGDCPNITLFPEVGSNIESLVLNRTSIEVPSTVFVSSRLMYLNMEGCKRLRNLPPAWRNQTHLKFIFVPNIGHSTRSSRSYTLEQQHVLSRLGKFIFRSLEI